VSRGGEPLETRVKKVLAWAAVLALTAGYTYGLLLWYDSTYTDLHIKYHSTEVYRLGYFEQGERVRALVVFNEGSVAVLEGRSVDVHLLNSDNRSKLELQQLGPQQGWTSLQTLHIETDETDSGSISYIAHTADTYYIVYQNFDWWNLTLRVAGGDALRTQLLIKSLWIGLLATTIVAFGYFYGRIFGIDVRGRLGLAPRRKGPGARAARERDVRAAPPSTSTGPQGGGRPG